MNLPEYIGVHWSTENFIAFEDRDRKIAVKKSRGLYFGKAVTFAGNVPNIFEFFTYEGHRKLFQFYLAGTDVAYYFEKGDLYSIIDAETESLLFYNGYPNGH